MRITVVVADDHAILREGIANLLQEHEDIRVVGTAGDGQQAVEETRRLTPDVVLMDASMPVLSGIEATRAILAEKPATAVIVVSMYDSGPIVNQALEAGARGYISKKSASTELVKAVRSVAAGKRYLGTGVVEIGVGSHTGLASLTSVEREILRHVVEGRSNAAIAPVLGLTARTVETYRSRMMRKLDLPDMASLVKFAIRHGITSID